MQAHHSVAAYNGASEITLSTRAEALDVIETAVAMVKITAVALKETEWNGELIPVARTTLYEAVDQLDRVLAATNAATQADYQMLKLHEHWRGARDAWRVAIDNDHPDANDQVDIEWRRAERAFRAFLNFQCHDPQSLRSKASIILSDRVLFDLLSNSDGDDDLRALLTSFAGEGDSHG